MLTVRLLNITGSAVLTTFVKAKVLSWSNRVNGPGRLVFRLPASDPKATDANLQAFKRIKLSRRKTDESGEDETVWYGYIESHYRSPDSPEEIEVQCAGLLQLFRARYTGNNEAFTGQGSTEAFGLLTDTNSGDGDTGITTGNGGVVSVQNITAAGRKDILGMWEEMAQAHGAEFEINTAGLFHFVPSLGTDKSATVRLVYVTDEPGSTVMDFAQGEDGAPLRNKVIGVDPSASLSSTRQDVASQATYGVLVEVKVFDEATDQTTLDALTQAHLDQVKLPIPAFAAQPILAEKRFSPATGARTVEGFQYGDVVPGDILGVRILTPNKDITSNKRVIEVLVDVNDEGSEQVNYTLGEAGAFVTVNSLAGREIEDLQLRVLEVEQRSSGGGGGGGGSSAFRDQENPSGSVNGSNTVFVLAETPITAGAAHVYVNGVLRAGGGADYSISSATITFVTAPETGDVIRVTYRVSSPGSFADQEVPTGSINGSNVTFTIVQTPTTGSLHLWRNGVLQVGAGSDYSLSGTTVTFVTAPETGDRLIASYRF